MNDLVALKKILTRLEKKYDKAEGKPLIQARIMKKAEATQAKIDKLNH